MWRDCTLDLYTGISSNAEITNLHIYVMCMHTHTHTHIYIYIYIYIYIHTHTPTHMQAHMDMHTILTTDHIHIAG